MLECDTGAVIGFVETTNPNKTQFQFNLPIPNQNPHEYQEPYH